MTSRRAFLYTLGLGTVSTIVAAAASIPFHGLTAIAVWVGTGAVTSFGLGLWLGHRTDKDGDR